VAVATTELTRVSRVRRPKPLDVRLRRGREAIIYTTLFLCAIVSVLTTFAIVAVLIEESWGFFRHVSITEFLTATEWTPNVTIKHYGILPLLSATLLMSFLAMMVAVPLGLAAAIYLSEYAPSGVRTVLKPILELLAGIPTVVYGYFALTFLTPSVLKAVFVDIGSFNALAASIAMGIMMLPLVSSLSEDSMRAVPQSLREGAYGLGANRFEVATRVVVPGALSGIVAACILAISRAVGETMIVTIAAGQQPNLSWNPLEGMQAMTAYIAQIGMGDTPRGTLQYSTIFAVGLVLFVVTLLLNIAAQWLLSRFREVYE
jgi:phosphate transport system permease protein